jgi:hypothetical protein
VAGEDNKTSSSKKSSSGMSKSRSKNNASWLGTKALNFPGANQAVNFSTLIWIFHDEFTIMIWLNAICTAMSWLIQPPCLNLSTKAGHDAAGGLDHPKFHKDDLAQVTRFTPLQRESRLIWWQNLICEVL